MLKSRGSIFAALNRLILKGGMRNNHAISIGLACMIAASTILLMRGHLPIFEDIEGSLLDARFQYRGAIPRSELVKIVAIDEKSIDEIGRWPWSREIVAELINKIDDLGAQTIALDIIFSEPQISHYDLLLQDDLTNGLFSDEQRRILEKKAQQTNPDSQLTAAIFMAGKVVNGHYFYHDDVRSSDIDDKGLLISSRVAAVKQKADDFRHINFASVRTNLPNIALAGEGAGYFNQIPDADGVVRTAPLVIKYQNDFYPSLALKALARYLNNAAIVVHADEFVITHVSVGDLKIPTNEVGGITVNYRGAAQSIEYISAYDILTNKVPTGVLDGALVLLGVTAIGVFDSHSSPYGPEFPGLEIQANVIESMVNQDAIVRTDFHILLDYTVILVIAIALAMVIANTSRVLSRFIFAWFLLAILVSVNQYYFSQYHQWFNLVYPLIALVSIFIILMLHQSFMVERRYSHVREAFKHYISPKLVDQLTKDPDLLNFGGQEKVLSILFSDIRNFTNLSEQLKPQELSRFLQAYMDPMTECVLNNKGTLDKYIGDAVMAIYGAPVPIKRHAYYSCISALNMLQELNHILPKVPDLAHLFPIKIGIGIHTGPVVVGNLGSSWQFNYTVIGDAVNLASRLEGLTKGYGVEIIISDSTYQLVKDDFYCREIDNVRVKGKQLPVTLYELIAERRADNQPLAISTWADAIAAYRQRQFEQARLFFSEYLAAHAKDVSAELYISRCAHFINEPPLADWDGVFTHTSK